MILADRVGATAAGRQIGCASTMINRWRREGHGGKGTPEPRTATEQVATTPPAAPSSYKAPFLCSCGYSFQSWANWSRHRSMIDEIHQFEHQLDDPDDDE